ncbi:MAG TPA: hypothetical protein VHK91_08580 [Flavisolibacter sp.]|nr:hypothetical protein [Flavisolibacter sp.]
MAKIIVSAALLFWCLAGASQQNFLVVRKKQRTVRTYLKDGRIAFQLHDGTWLAGLLTSIKPDSFYLRRELIRTSLYGSDTLHIGIQGFSLSDVYALPTRKELIYYDQDQVRVIPGNEKFVWIRNGFLFRVAGAGYLGLNILNHLISGDPPFVRSNLGSLGIGAGLFLVGEWLGLRYDPYIHFGKKYQLECVVLRP